MKQLIYLLLFPLSLFSADLTYDPVHPLAPTVPVEQIPGNVQQIYGLQSTLYAAVPTNSLAQTNAGVSGGDLCATTLLPDGRIFGECGDSITTYQPNNDGIDFTYTTNSSCTSGTGTATGSCLGVDTAFLLPSGSDFSHCNAIQLGYNQLNTGTIPTSLSYSGCPVPTFLTDPTHVITSTPLALFANYTTGLSASAGPYPPESTLGGKDLNTVWTVGTTMYGLYNVEAVGKGSCVLTAGCNAETILLSAATSTGSLSSTVGPAWAKVSQFSAPPVFPAGTGTIATLGTTLTGSGYSASWQSGSQYSFIQVCPHPCASNTFDKNFYTVTNATSTTISINPAITSSIVGTLMDFFIIPNETNNTGHFMHASVETLTSTQINNQGITSFLPSSLQAVVTGGGSLLFFFGSGFCDRCSNLYMSVMDPTTLPSLSALWTLSSFNSNGSPNWTLNSEATAAPLLTSWNHGGSNPNGQCIGDNSVRYEPLLSRFVLIYGSAECGGLQLRTANLPWQWSTEQSIFPNNVNTYPEGALIYFTGGPAPNFAQQPAVFLKDPASNPCTPYPSCLLNINTESGSNPWSKLGNVYGGYLFPSSTSFKPSPNSVSLVFDFLAFNPYTSTIGTITLSTPTKVEVQGTTSTQALLHVTTSHAPCTFQGSEGATYTAPGVNDLNPSLFSLANSSTRPEAITNTNEIFFPIGKRSAEKTLSGFFASRALHQSTLHNYSVTCGTDPTISGQFTTTSPGMGDASGPTLNSVFDSTGPNNYSWPTINWTDQTTSYIDPFTGVLIKRITGQGLTDTNSQTQNKLSTWVGQPASAWTNPAGFLASGTATYSGSGTTSDYILLPLNSGLDPTHNGAILGTYFPLQDALIRLNGEGSDSTPTNRVINGCLVTGSLTCLSGIIPFTLPQTTPSEVQGPGSLTSGTWIPSPLFSLWGFPSGPLPINTPMFSQASGNLSCVGTSCTQTSGNQFAWWWPANTPILITGGGGTYQGVTDLSQVATVTSPTTLTLVSPVTTVSNVAYTVQPVMLKLWKATGTGSISITYMKSDTANSEGYSTGDEGDGSNMNPLTVTTPVSPSGTPLSTPLTAYPTLFGDQSGNQRLYLFVPSTGESRPLSGLVIPYNPAGCTIWNGITWNVICNAVDSFGSGRTCTTFPVWNPINPLTNSTSGYCTVYTGSSNTLVILQWVYLYSTTPNSLGVTCDYRSYTDNWNENNLSSCIQWTNTTPASLSQDIPHQITAFNPSFNLTYFNKFQFYGGSGQNFGITVEHNCAGSQNCYASVFTFNLQSNTIIAEASSWTTWPARWGVNHGGGYYATNNWGGQALTSPADNGNPVTKINITTVVSPHDGPGTQVGSNLATNGEPCTNDPHIPDPRWTPPIGATCLHVIIPTEAAEQSPSTADYTNFPYPHNSTACFGDNTTSNCWAQLQTLQPGDSLVDGATGWSSSEDFLVVDKYANTGLAWDLWLWRAYTYNPAGTSGCTEAIPFTHIDGFSLDTKPYYTCNGNNFWFTNTDTHGTAQLVDEPSVTSGHASTGYIPASNLVTSYLAAGSDIGPGNYLAYRPGASVPSFVGSLGKYFLPFIPQFTPSTSSTSALQTHPNQAQFAAIPNEQQWVIDGNPYGAAHGSTGPFSLYTPTITSTSVSGVYLVSNISTVNYKLTPIVVTGGAPNVKEISGPSSTITTSNLHTYCYTYISGECIPGSTAGNVYVNIPATTASGDCYLNQYDFLNPCVMSTGARAMNITQQGFLTPDPALTRFRSLGMMLGGPGRQNNFWNAHLDPTGQWAFVDCVWCDNLFSSEIFAYQVPSWRIDSVNRGTFLNIPIPLAPGADARIRFGYNPQYECLQYQGYCQTSSTATTSNPFLLSTDSTSFTPCASGCTITIPALSGRLVYYIVDRGGISLPPQIIVSQ